jgi:membrane-associated phospholipid phosphatase
MNILYEFGEYGPIILILLSWYLLWNNKYLFFYYTIGIFANAILNIIFKGIIQEPRPIFDTKKVNLMKTHAKHYFFQNGIPFNMFGMPSGHAQASLFSTVFIYLSLKQKNLLYIFIPLSLLTCYQRVKLEYHSISQIIVGSIVGALFAYFMYNLAREKIKGIIREKPDDDAII